MSEQEREAAKAEWRERAAQLVPKAVASPSAADRALMDLRAAWNRLGADPDQLTLSDVDWIVTGGLVKDVRGLLCAHELLVLADRVGLFALSSDEAAKARRVRIYEGIYEPVLRNLDPLYKHVVHAVIHGAARYGLVAEYHVATMTTGLVLHETFHGELREVNRRLNKLETAVENVGRQLFNTINELRGLQKYIHDKEQREQKVALVKAAVKLGVSLVPLASGVLNVSVDVVAAFADGAMGAKAMYQLMADPTDVTAALQVFRSVQDAEESLAPELRQTLAGLVHPYESLGAVVEDLETTAGVLGTDAGAAADDVAGTTTGTAGLALEEPLEGGATVEGTTAKVEAAEDKWSEPKEVAQDTLMDQGVDEADKQRRGGATARPVVPPARPMVTHGGASPRPAVSPAPPAATAGSTVAGASGATRGGGRPLPRARVSSGAGHPGPAPRAPLSPLAAVPCAPPRAGGGGAAEVRAPGRPRSPVSPVLDACSRVGLPPASSPLPSSVLLPPPLPSRRRPPSPPPHHPVGAPSEDRAGAVTATEHLGGEDFFDGVLRWGIDTVAAKLVAYVTVGYPPEEVVSFEAAVRAGTAREFINGAAVVRCDDAAVAETTARLLGAEWRTRLGPVGTVQCFYREAKEHVRAAQGGGGAPLWGAPPRR